MAAFISKIFCTPRVAIRQLYNTRHYIPPRFARCQFDPALRGIPGAFEDLNDTAGEDNGDCRGLQFDTPLFRSRCLTPEWVFSDVKVQQLLLAYFPCLHTDEKQRLWARRWVAVIYYFYRLHWTQQRVADELGLQEDSMKKVIKRIRKRGNALFAPQETD